MAGAFGSSNGQRCRARRDRLFVGVYPVTAAGLALVGGSAAAVYAVWTFALSRVPAQGAVRAAAVLALVMAGLANGAAGLFPCPPLVFVGGESPCPLSPWQDFAHLGSLIFGVSAFVALRKVPLRLAAAHAWLLPAAIVVLIIHLGLATAFAI